jgi:hypothetical protein
LLALLVIYIFHVCRLQDTDLIVSALTMTTEREEAIDFVVPYFEKSAIAIGI